jgi:cytochrome b561/polyisoprenoid-binding protein YceI
MSTNAIDSSQRYTEVARILHWLIAGLIVVNFILHELAEEAVNDAQELALWANHKSVGMTVLMLAVIRLVWRFTHAVPPLPPSMPRWQVLASQVSHFALYGLIFALPMFGWLYSSAESYSVSWFNLFVFPDLVWDNKELAEVFEEGHEIAASIMFYLALLHILAALKHALYDRDGVLSRISSTVSVTLFVIAIVAGVTVLNAQPAAPDAAVEPAAESTPEPAAAEPAAATSVDTTLPAWTIDHARSAIQFTAEQAGAPFTGTWPAWSAEIRFSPDNLAASSAQVEVDVTRAPTGDNDRDSTLGGAEWFDSTNHPSVLFRSIDITADAAGGYTATGMLRIRNREYPVLLTFIHNIVDGEQVLEGKTTLDRLALDLGTGEWADTTQIGQSVELTFKVTGTATT